MYSPKTTYDRRIRGGWTIFSRLETGDYLMARMRFANLNGLGGGIDLDLMQNSILNGSVEENDLLFRVPASFEADITGC